MWRGVAADIVNAAAFYSLRKTQVLGYPEDNVIALGLSCLDTALSMLSAIHGVFSEYTYNTIDKPDIFNQTINCDYVTRLGPGLEKFLQAMQKVVFYTAFVDELAWHLTIIYGVLLLFLVRCVLRSAFRCAEHGFSAVENRGAQNRDLQDPSYEQGSSCPIYQLYLAALRQSSTTLAETWPSEEHKDEKSLWLYAQCQRAGKLLAMPDGLRKTLREHLEYSIDRWLDL